MKLSPRALGLTCAVLTVLIWSSFIVVARASAAHNLFPLDIAFLRIIGAGCVLLPWGWWLMRAQRQSGEAVGSLLGLSPLPLRITALAGFFGSLLYAMLAYSGFFFAPAAHASVLMPGSLPLWTSLLAIVVLHDRITRVRAIGLACIVLGDLFVGGASLLKAFDGGEVWKGDLLFMSAAFCWACYTVLVRRHALDPVRATIAITAFSWISFVPLYTLAAFAGWVPTHLGTAPLAEMMFQAIYQGVGSVVISGITFNVMIRHYGPVRSTMITALVPGLSALGAVVFLSEPMSLNLLAGLALVTCGILFGVRLQKP
jgi:drug/metabolite transporter (DMT)-like permease